ncbi:hypothetical protein [Frondihabitans australicus]|uniref:Uncharacterized protein n=1 Tax=Frondihabitans australicus TaxID=386892 RepID=A0A495IL72_9MICO|nr:hypothetical protein [Frondihabitans australicus]RKR76693.1 hypothetical protein C8E83_3870 [Frondihabitans australicus]
MVSPILKTLGAVVVGTPVAVVLGLTARSIRKQEDAQVPVIRSVESPLAVTVFRSWLDRRTHEHLAATSFKKGYVSYGVRVENHSAHDVRGIHVELLDTAGDVVSSVRVGEIDAHASTVVPVKRAWTNAFEAHRAAESVPPVVLTWRSASGRRRVVLAPSLRRDLGVTPSSIRQGRRERPTVDSPVMS